MGDCADEGQGDLANAQGKLAAANKDQLAKQATAGTTLDTKKTACTASVAFNVNLDTLESSKCYDTTKEQSYINAKRTCTSATSAMTKADEAVTIAKSTVKDGQQDYDNAVASAAQLKSACHCGVKKEQAQAWTAASEATAAHAADWKQAHEVICALDPTISFDELPDCPAVEQVTLSNDVSNEKCTQAQIDAPSSEEAGRSYTKKTGTYCGGTGQQTWYLGAQGPSNLNPYVLKSIGNCAGYAFIQTKADCIAAAVQLGLDDITASSTSSRRRPHGCYYKASSSVSKLWFNSDGDQNDDDTARVSVCTQSGSAQQYGIWSSAACKKQCDETTGCTA